MRSRSLVLGAVLASSLAALDARAEIRVDGLSAETPKKVLIFTVRGEGVVTPLIAFQERARATVEGHMNARVLSIDETLAKGGIAFQKRLADCRGEPKCLSELVGKVDASHLLVLTARLAGELRLVGSRLVDLRSLTVLGEAVDEVPSDKNVLDVVPDRIKASVPADLWDPFGTLAIDVAEPGAQIRVNGRIVGMSPMSPLGYLMPGEYRVEVVKDGFTPASATAQIERGIEAKVSLAPAALAREGGSSWLLWAGIGAVVVAGAATAAALTLGASGEAPTFCSAVDPSRCP
ncbi:PEGA domain-containing protein [Myxococcota bacterium]|nr:PEGA domain-containing protein [Myxococcota bacterium]